MLGAMTSIFDRHELNDALFYPRPDRSPAPPGARDELVDVPGARLHVRRHAPAPGARATVLLFHGNGEVVADYDEAAAAFAAAGATLAVADYRGYGQSSGTPTLRALIDDARAVAEAVRAACAGPLVVFGRSLGGAAAHELYADPVAGTAAVVLESTYFDLPALIARRGLAVPPLSADDRARFEPAGKLARGRLPLLILHGERDALIAHDEAVAALAAAGSADKQLVTIPRRGHNDVSLADAYWDALARFLARVT